MSDLKPCPFCGGEADYVPSVDTKIQCQSCGAATGYGNNDAEIINAWNTRHSDPDMVPVPREPTEWMAAGARDTMRKFGWNSDLLFSNAELACLHGAMIQAWERENE